MVDNVFGFAKIHPDKPNGEMWALADPNNDDRFDTNQEVIENNDNTFRFRDDDDAEIAILTSALFDDDDIVDDHGALDIDNAGRGYMMNIKDWRDIEFDFVLLVDDYTAVDGITIGVGGGRHSNPQPFCEGCAYKLHIYYNGGLEWVKEQWHNNKVPPPTHPAGEITGGIKDKLLIGKLTRINKKSNDGKSYVELVFYVNLNGDKKTYTELTRIVDSGGWGSSGAECNGNPDQILNWAYPMVLMSWNNATRIDWLNFTVREIQPTSPLPEDPTDPGQPIPPEQPTGHVQKILSFRFPIASTLATSCDGILPTQPQQDPVPPIPPGSPPTVGTISVYWSDFWKNGS